MKKYSFILFILFCTTTIAQEKKDFNPLRIGVKIGTPNVLGGNIEYVTPILNNKIAFFIDYSGFTVNDNESKVGLTYLEAGTNIYFKNNGRGLYSSISYGKLNLDGNYTDAETINGTLYDGKAEGSISVNTLNAKLGAKLGNKFYFRIEAGYGFGDIPQQIEITGTETGSGLTKTDYVEIPSDIPGIGENGYLVFNIGFGISI